MSFKNVMIYKQRVNIFPLTIYFYKFFVLEELVKIIEFWGKNDQE